MLTIVPRDGLFFGGIFPLSPAELPLGAMSFILHIATPNRNRQFVF